MPGGRAVRRTIDEVGVANAANAESIGLGSATFEMDIERGKIREFAWATGSSHRAYLVDPRPVIPPTFLTTQATWQDDAADPWLMSELNRGGGLHAEPDLRHAPAPS